jgi:hypothetical protein
LIFIHKFDGVVQQAQGIAKSGAKVLNSSLVILSPPKTNYIRFFLKFISYKFVLASLGAKSKLLASI